MYYTLKEKSGNYVVEKKRLPLLFARKKLDKWVDTKGEKTYYSKSPIDLKGAVNAVWKKDLVGEPIESEN